MGAPLQPHLAAARLQPQHLVQVLACAHAPASFQNRSFSASLVHHWPCQPCQHRASFASSPEQGTSIFAGVDLSVHDSNTARWGPDSNSGFL